MAMCRIEIRKSMSGIQFIDCHGQLIGEYYYNASGYANEAVTIRDGREQYVLKMRNTFILLLIPAILLTILLPEWSHPYLITAVCAIWLFFPNSVTIWEDGKLLAKRDRKRRFLIGQNCYKLRHHSGYKSSLMKNGVQVALYTMKTAYETSHPHYEVLYDAQEPMDTIILFCVYLGAADSSSERRNSKTWTTWVPFDRHRQQVYWHPPEPRDPATQHISTSGLPGDSTN